MKEGIGSMSKTKSVKHEYPRLSVVWADHFIHNGDHDIADVIKEAKPVYGEYTGYCVYENKQILVLCSNIWEDGTVSDPMFIMKRAIKERLVDE
jgi:hypothetical protein